MGNLASLTFMLGANIKGFQTNMRKASQSLNKVGKDMKRMGKQVSMYATAPILAMGAASVAAFDKQAQAEQKLAAQLRANGKDVDSTMAGYKKLASELQNVSIVGDETTLGLMQLAESMQAPDVAGAAKGAIGLSKALGVDLQAAIKMVVLAQNGEYTMLNRYVPSLRAANSETEKAAIVQKLYADGLDIAATEAETGLGPLKQLQNSMGDLMEMFGAIVADAIKPAVEWLKKVVDKFQGLSDRGKKVIVIVAGVVAAIGPMLVIFGTMATMLPVIAAGFAALTGPIGLVVAAIAGIAAAFIYVYGNFEAFKERLTRWAWFKNKLIDVVKFIAEIATIMWRPLLDALGMDFITPAIDKLDAFKEEVPPLKTEFKGFGETIKEVAGDAMTALGLFGDEAEESFKKVETAAISAGNAVGRFGHSVTALVPKKIDDVDLTANVNYGINVAPLPAKTIEEFDNFESGLTRLEQTASMVGQTVGSTFEDMGNRMVASLNLAETGFQGFVRVILQTVIQLIAMMLAQSLAQAIAGATSSGAATGPGAAIATPIFIATAIAGVLSAFAAIPAFASGGVVPPGFPNDTYLARLTSGETIYPAGIPLGSINHGGSERLDVVVHGQLSGEDILISGEKSAKKRMRTRGY